jgi:hypothetical protein
MQCYQCGAKIRPGLKVCSNCGARLDINADPLEDPRAPRVFNDSITPAPRPGRREASRRDGRYDSSSAEYSAEYSDPRGRNQRNIPNDRRRPQPETRDERRSPRSAYEASEYRDGRDRRSAAALADNQAHRPYRSRDQTSGYGQNGRRDRATGRSRTGQDSPVLQMQSPAWTVRGGGSAAGTSIQPSTRRRLTIFAVVAVIVMLSIGAVAALRGTSILSRIRGGSPISDNAPPFVAYTPGPTPAPSSGYKEFDSSHSLYVLDYPQSWSTSSSSSGAGTNFDYVDKFTRTSPLATVVVEEAGAFSSITQNEIIQAEVQGANGEGQTFTQISNPITTVEIAGEQWLRADYLITETDGTKFHMAILACHHNQRGYALVLLGLPDTFSQDTGTVFEPILNTFHFTG